jgi:hypothetical protein
MLLETLDVKKNDVVIYSQNIFDLEKNFKIIYKDDHEKRIKDIDYAGVCDFVNEYNPKNLIVYRLLTNIKNFEIYLSKYGYVVNINSSQELIYFDPVFAIKELEDYSEAVNHYDLRFRIQQVGLTTLNREGNRPNYAEIYSIDLEASEAKFQNDKTFVEAIFFAPNKKQGLKNTIESRANVKSEESKSLRETKENADLKKFTSGQHEKSPEIKSESSKEVVKQKNLEEVKGNKNNIGSHDIAEDKNFDYRQINKIKFKSSQIQPELDKERGAGDERLSKNNKADIPKSLKDTDDKENTFGKFLKSKQKVTQNGKVSSSTAEIEPKSELIDLFKSSTSMDKIFKRKENRQIVLKLDDK